MKKIILVGILSVFLSCSSDDDCQAKKDEINAYYEQQIQQVKDNPEPSGINYRQIQLLIDERNNKMQTACD